MGRKLGVIQSSHSQMSEMVSDCSSVCSSESCASMGSAVSCEGHEPDINLRNSINGGTHEPEMPIRRAVSNSKFIHHYMFIISQLWLTARPRKTVVLLSTGTPGSRREIYSKDADDEKSTTVEK